MKNLFMTLRRIVFIFVPLFIIAFMSSGEWVARSQMIENSNLKDVVYSIAYSWDQKVQKVKEQNKELESDEIKEVVIEKMERETNIKTENVLIKNDRLLKEEKIDNFINKSSNFEKEIFNNKPEMIPEKEVKEEINKILMIGDSLMNEVAFGFKNNLDKNIKIKDIHKSSTGLTNKDYYDWPSVAKKEVLNFKPDIVFIHLGGNDGQDLKENGKFVRLYSKDWSGIYQERAENLIREIKKSAPTAKIVWIGLPAMRDAKYEKKTAVIREAQKKASNNQGVIFIDSKEALGNDYVKQKKINNKMLNLRRTDGIHYSREGGEQIALYSIKKSLK